MEKLKFGYSLENIPTPEKKLPTMLLREDRHLFHKNAYKSYIFHKKQHNS